MRTILKFIGVTGLFILATNYMLNSYYIVFQPNQYVIIDINRYGEMIPELIIFSVFWLIGAWYTVTTIRGLRKRNG